MKSRNLHTNDICVVGGCGRVGLPLGLAFADKNHKVVLYDVNKISVDKVNSGRMPFIEDGADEILKKVAGKNLIATTDVRQISEAEYIVIVIGTPVDEHLNPEFYPMTKLFGEILPFLKDGQIVILRSTVYPGTTEKLQKSLKTKGLKTKLSFCPERIAEGYAMKELVELPQIVSGFDEETVRKVSRLFSVLTEDIVALEPIEAEMAKLFTNTWRYIQFSIANQFYMVANSYGLDFYRIYEAMKYKYPRAKDFPKPGFAAGPCLFKDTMQIASFYNNSFFLGHAAMLINEGLPNYIVQSLKKYGIENKTVGILGMAFKANSDDKRESLSYKLKKILEIEAKKVLCSDIYIEENGFIDERTLVAESDIIVVAAPHKEYSNLKNLLIDKKVVDVWNFYGNGGLI